jgi:L-rhamnose isomerase/sugar isomerase
MPARIADLKRDYESLGERLDRRGIKIDAIKDKVANLRRRPVLGRRHRRHALCPLSRHRRAARHLRQDRGLRRHPAADAGDPTVSLHIPWDKADPNRLKQAAARFGLGFDAMNSNTFSDAKAQRTPTSSARSAMPMRRPASRRRAQSRMHRDRQDARLQGADRLDRRWLQLPRPGQFRQAVRVLSRRDEGDLCELPADWKIFTEHKMYEPAFYSTVVQDWGTNYLIAQELGPKAICLVDLGHHAPNVNIEMIVSRLIQFKKLGGFHFNDSASMATTIWMPARSTPTACSWSSTNWSMPNNHAEAFDPAHMLDQSHNVTDPIESLMLLGDRSAARLCAGAAGRSQSAGRLSGQGNDALMATQTLKAAFRTDVEPILAMARYEAGGAIAPVAAYRASGYRAKVPL